MTHGSRKVGPRRWRETFGRYYRQLKDLLELGHGKLAPVPGPR